MFLFSITQMANSDDRHFLIEEGSFDDAIDGLDLNQEILEEGLDGGCLFYIDQNSMTKDDWNEMISDMKDVLETISVDKFQEVLIEAVEELEQEIDGDQE